MPELSDHEMMRRGLWSETVVAVLSAPEETVSSNKARTAGPVAWAVNCADTALAEFDQRFRKPEGFE